MKLTRYGRLILCIVALAACISFAEEEVHPEVTSEECECGIKIDSSQSAEYHITSYAEMINSIVPALQVIAHNGCVAPSVEVLHGYAQVILHGLEGGLGGEHGDLVPLNKEIPDLGEMPLDGATRSDWIEYFGSEEALRAFEDSPSPTAELLAPIQDSLDVVKQANSKFRRVPSPNDYIGLITIRGGALCLIDRTLTQLSIYAQETFPDNPGQQLYIETMGHQVQTLLQLAQESAVACIYENDYDAAAAHMLNINAYLFAAMGNSLSHGERPVTATGLFFLIHNLLGWTWFGI
ncbi:hypothetical protein KAJ02_06405 [Candidatus Bipolaricaulota bacterium]|nr:hypothetical protein [Candidatus Bipolaricaulota bacterium]